MTGSGAYDPRITAVHEAAHATACIILGRAIQCVRIDRPHYDMAGHVVTNLDDDTIDLRDIIIALVGYIAEGAPDWPPAWPIRRDEVESLGVLVEYLKLDEDAYRQLCRTARGMVDEPSFQTLARTIQRALLAVPHITGAELLELRDAVLTTHE